MKKVFVLLSLCIVLFVFTGCDKSKTCACTNVTTTSYSNEFPMEDDVSTSKFTEIIEQGNCSDLNSVSNVDMIGMMKVKSEIKCSEL